MPRATSPGFAPAPDASIAERLVLRFGNTAQRAAVLELTSKIWAGGLSAEGFVQLNMAADQEEFARRNKLFFVLVDRESPDSIEVYASAEVYIRDMLLLLPGQKVPEKRRAGCLHRLFVPPGNRNHGLGKLALAKLQAWISAQADLQLDLCYGFAQAGEGVFRNHSTWHDRYGLVFDAAKSPTPSVHELTTLTLDNLPELVAADNALMEQDFVASAPSNIVRFAIEVNAAPLRTRILGHRLVARQLNAIATDTIGWQTGDPTDRNSFACLIFMTVVAEDALVIMRVRAPTPAHMRSLLAAAGAEAVRLGLKRVRCFGGVDPSLMTESGLDTAIVAQQRPGVAWIRLDLANLETFRWSACQTYAACVPL